MRWYNRLMAKIWFWYVWKFVAVKPDPDRDKKDW